MGKANQRAQSINEECLSRDLVLKKYFPHSLHFILFSDTFALYFSILSSAMSRTLMCLLLVLSLLSASCRHHSRRHVTTAFYHWKSTVKLSPYDQDLLDSTHCRKLYVNFFDVIPNDDTALKYPAVPGSQTQGLGRLPQNAEIVPVVFITNESMKKMDSATIPLMAEKICSKINRYVKWYKLKPIREMQFDCDWTHSTRDRYFYLLTEIKRRSGVPTISATIRLYQYKYFTRAGVPPVDRGVLMFYHMNAMQDVASKELILDVDEGKKYLTHDKYPLPLDFALPVFSAMMTTQSTFVSVGGGRMERSIGFYPPSVFKRLMADTVLKKVDTAENLYKTVKDGRVGDLYLWGGGELVKMETVKIGELRRAADLLSAHANTDTFSVIFFHLDHDVNSIYTTDEIKDIISRFD